MTQPSFSAAHTALLDRTPVPDGAVIRTADVDYELDGTALRALRDPDRRLGGAYVMNKQSTDLLGDHRPRRLIEAAYASL